MSAMPQTYTPASFTKNFSWHQSYRRLHTSIGKGFFKGTKPTARDDWRAGSGIGDPNRELIPMNFFLFSYFGAKEDYILPDHFVEVALTRAYSGEFALLSLFTFHLALPGRWRKTIWPNGRVAGWANDLVREASDDRGTWNPAAFRDGALRRFIAARVIGHPVTTTKVFTNYRYMLNSASVVVNEVLQPPDLTKRWHVDAVQVFLGPTDC
jgi:hypothetical protein